MNKCNRVLELTATAVAGKKNIVSNPINVMVLLSSLVAVPIATDTLESNCVAMLNVKLISFFNLS